MSKNLRYNRYTRSLHLSNNPFPVFSFGEKPGVFGAAIKLSPNVYALVTKGKIKEATEKLSADVEVLYTKWPRVRLVMAFIKEAVNA